MTSIASSTVISTVGAPSVSAAAGSISVSTWQRSAAAGGAGGQSPEHVEGCSCGGGQGPLGPCPPVRWAALPHTHLVNAELQVHVPRDELVSLAQL